MIGEIIGAGLGAAGTAIQHGYNEDAMNLQAQLNEQAAQRNQDRNKDMWNYTNYENQVAHMKAAGLNPALMYSNGGAGGQTNGAQAQGVSAIGGNEVSAGSQAAGMALNTQMLESQIEVNKAQAAKLNADATKTAGVDTELGKADTEFKKSLRALTENQATGASWDWQKSKSTIENIEAMTRKANEETRLTAANAQVAEKTINENIELASQKVVEIKSNVALNNIHTEESKQKIQNLKVDILKTFNDMKVSNSFVQQGWNSQEQNWQKIYNELKLGERKLDQNEEFFAKDLFHGLMNLITFGK